MVDIIVPFFGCYESVVKTFVAIQSYTPNISYTVNLVDDGSENSNFIKEFTANRKRTFGKRLESQAGFSASVNQGILMCKNPLVAVMHSDVYPQNIYWLSHMIKVLKENKDSGVKFVSARVDNPGTSNDYPSELINDNKADSEIVIAEKPLPWICCLMHRELFKKVGGGLMEYYPCWYEDAEWFERMKHFGFKQGIAMRSVVSHAGGLTINKLIKNKEMREKMENNAKFCKEDISIFKKVKA